MKAIIQGKRYDTETATFIAEASGGDGRGDFRFYEEALYKTPRSGAYFLAGKGGPLSRWAQRVSNGSVSGSGIKPLTHEDALMWAEAHMSADEIETHFGDAIKDA